MRKKKIYVGVVYLYKNKHDYKKKKSYGATSRQYSASSPKDLRRIFRKKFKFRNNIVKVANIRRIRGARR